MDGLAVEQINTVNKYKLLYIKLLNNVGYIVK